MQSDIPMVKQTQKSKVEVQIQHGGRLFSENGSSTISAVDRDVSSKFSMLVEVDFGLPK